MAIDQAWQSVQQLLAMMRQCGGSDMFITADFSPAIKRDGKMTPLSEQIISADLSRTLVLSTMNERQRQEFLQTNECNFAISVAGIGRFRVSAFVQQGRVGMVISSISLGIGRDGGEEEWLEETQELP